MAGGVGRIARSIQEQGLAKTIRAALFRRGIIAYRFWWVREPFDQATDDALTALPPGYRAHRFGPDEFRQIEGLIAAGAPLPEDAVEASSSRGDECLGITTDAGQVVGFTWAQVGRAVCDSWPTPLAPDEAYLFGMYVIPEVRGLNLAPILRRLHYRELLGRGVRVGYSVTARHNIPSWRFKQKLGAEKVFLGAYIGVRRQRHFRMKFWTY